MPGYLSCSTLPIIAAVSVALDPGTRLGPYREAEVLASLNHPNIAHQYGIERSGGTLAPVMELVEESTVDVVLNWASMQPTAQ